MGNCCSSESSSEESKPDLVLNLTGVQGIDNLFQAASAPLKTLSEVSESLRNAINAYQTSTGTDILKDYTVADSMFGMLYIFSANIENIISHIDFKLIDESPYLALDKK